MKEINMSRWMKRDLNSKGINWTWMKRVILVLTIQGASIVGIAFKVKK